VKEEPVLSGTGPGMAGMIYLTLEWIRHHQAFLQLMGVISLATFLITPLAIWFIIIRTPQEYFLHDRDYYREMSMKYRPLVRFLLHVVKNGAGIVFLLAGIAMLVLPGQGVITILVGLTLLDFPGKRTLELKIIRQRKVLSTVNWMRARSGKPPLKVPRKP
jgi:hypothetical protein